MKTMKKLLAAVLAILLATAGIPAAAVSPRWYESDDRSRYPHSSILDKVEIWPEVQYVQAGIFEYVETKWGN